MKKITKTILILAAANLCWLNFAFAQSENISQDLGVSKPMVLPTNPFYFLKEFKRGVQKTFVFNPVKKLELELQIASEKMAELGKLEEIIGQDDAALIKAINNYENNLDGLSGKIKNIQENYKNNSRLDSFLDDFVANGAKHIEFLSYLKSKTNDIKILQKLGEAQDKIAALVAQILAGTESGDILESRLERAFKKTGVNLVEKLKAIGALDKIEEKLSAEEKNRILDFKETLIINTQSGIKTEEIQNIFISAFEELQMDSLSKIRIIDEIKEGAINDDIKSALNSIRQEVLERAQSEKDLQKVQAENMVNEADSLVNELMEKLKNLNLKSEFINLAISKADFNLTQAKNSFQYGDYGQVFTLASAAASAARSALTQVLKFEENTGNFDNDIQNLKEKYDELSERARSMNLDKVSAPEFFEFMKQSESLLVKISDYVNKKLKASSDTIISSIKNVKILLSQAENELKQY
ncbi:MAG: DUF5667 domain-containing protein [Candidatus Pacebacteria bacterium]|nr:DUF5667 domain-containing protein [Candidatus Paceibacterota bacterium]